MCDYKRRYIQRMQALILRHIKSGKSPNVLCNAITLATYDANATGRYNVAQRRAAYIECGLQVKPRR